MLLFVTIYYIVHYFEVNFCSVLLAVNIFESNLPWWQMHKYRGLYGLLSKLWNCCVIVSLKPMLTVVSVLFIRVPVSFRMQQSQSHHTTPVSSQSGDVLVRLQPVSELHLYPAQDLRQPHTHGRAEKRQVHLQYLGSFLLHTSPPPKPLHQVAKQQLALIHIQLRSPLSPIIGWCVNIK